MKPRAGVAISFALRMVLAGLGGSWRYRVQGAERLASLAEGPGLVAFWHQQLPACGIFVKRRLLVGGREATTIVSQSRDGEIAARAMAPWGIEVVRGSSSRSGREALRGLYKALKQGRLIAFAPDGPRGPAREAKVGLLALAQLGEVPVVPLAAAASRVWRLGSWDRMEVPQPFARVELAVGEGVSVAAGEDLEEAARRLGRALDEARESLRP